MSLKSSPTNNDILRPTLDSFKSFPCIHLIWHHTSAFTKIPRGTRALRSAIPCPQRGQPRAPGTGGGAESVPPPGVGRAAPGSDQRPGIHPEPSRSIPPAQAARDASRDTPAPARGPWIPAALLEAKLRVTTRVCLSHSD